MVLFRRWVADSLFLVTLGVLAAGCAVENLDPQDPSIEDVRRRRDSGSVTDSGTATDAGGSVDTGSPSGANGTIVPLYTYPTDSSWSRLASAARAHPRVHVVAVINPNSGPTPTADSAYTTGIASLRAAGVTVVGYVATGYASRAQSAVTADIDTYRAVYPALDGIFFDEAAIYETGHESVYSAESSYARSRGFGFLVANPGTAPVSSYASMFDVAMVYESAGSPSRSSLDRYASTRTHAAIIPYGVGALDTAYVASILPDVEWVYITDDNLPNPWDSLPSYFEALVIALDDGSGGGTSADAGSPVDAGTPPVDAGTDTGTSPTDAGTGTTDSGTTSTTATGTIVPLYTYPTDSSWSRLATAARAHPSVHVVAVINPNSGPTPTADSAYTNGIASLRAAGVTVVGYVATGYGSRDPNVVTTDIDTYRTVYPTLDGIFFDEAAIYETGHESVYSTEATHARARGFGFLIANPGTAPVSSYASLFDVSMVYESGGVPSRASLDRYASMRTHAAIIPYGVGTLDAAYVASIRADVEWIYITNDNLPNPWDTLPSYFEALMTALE